MKCRHMRNEMEQLGIVLEIDRCKREGIPVHTTCARLKVPYNSYWLWKKKINAPSSSVTPIVTSYNPRTEVVLVGIGVS